MTEFISNDSGPSIQVLEEFVRRHDQDGVLPIIGINGISEALATIDGGEDGLIFQALEQLQNEIREFEAGRNQEWEEVSLSSHDTESGYDGSNSDISDVVELSSHLEEFRHDEQCHFGFLVVSRLVEEREDNAGSQPDHPLNRNEFSDWLKQSEDIYERVLIRKRAFDDDEGEEDYPSDKLKKPKRDIDEVKRLIRCNSEVCVTVTRNIAKHKEHAVRKSATDTAISI